MYSAAEQFRAEQSRTEPGRDNTGQRRPQMVEHTDELEKSVERLGIAMNALKDRLSAYTVTKPEPGRPEPDGPMPTLCPAAERIMHIAGRVGMYVNAAEAMLRDLEI